jgi:pimeloyl-ACP methyl ester carboxylesterase
LRPADPTPDPLKTTHSHRGISPRGTAYLIGGEPDPERACACLVLIHGVGLNKDVWLAQVEAFSREYQVISYDILGHGDSPLPSSNPCLEEYTAQLAELLEHLNISKAHIVGHSMGALISVAFALEYAAVTCSVIAMNIVYERDVTQRKAVQDRARAVLQSGRVSGIELALQRWFENESSEASQQKIARIRRWMEQVDPAGYGRSYQLFASSDRAFTGRLSTLRTPILYLTGSLDSNSTPVMSQKMAAETSNGQVAVIENEAHMMAYIHPEKVNHFIGRFLDEVSA